MNNNVEDNTCKICNSPTQKVFTTQILNKYQVTYYQCISCDFLQTEKPYWLEEAYSNSMNLTDTGIMHRNSISSKVCASLLFLIFGTKEKCLDYAGGYGVFTRIMRDYGFNFFWFDPYTLNVMARGFEHDEKNTYTAVTTFESFEHFENPITELEKILQYSNNIIFSTELVPNKLPKPGEWWYYGLEHGQHIALHNKKSLQALAKKFDLNFYSLGNLHLFTQKKINPIFQILFKFKFAKHILFGLSFFFEPFIKSRTFSDMSLLKNNL
jgi:hypothetical protein